MPECFFLFSFFFLST